MIEQLAKILVRFFPTLSDEMKSAKLKDSAEDYMKKIIVNAVMISIVVLFLVFVVISGMKARDTTLSYNWLLIVFPAALIFSFYFFRQIPIVYMRREEVEMNKNILFAGRYLL